MGFELTQSAVFYIILMVVVVFIGLAIVAGGNPIILLRQQQFSGMFEPGKVAPKSDINPYVELSCGDPSRVIINKASFIYNGKPADKEGSIDFIVILDFNSRIFLGKDESSADARRIYCSAKPSDEMSDCPPVTMQFDLIGRPLEEGKTSVFHFTVWKANQALIDAAQEDKMTISKLLETYSYYYVSSFDISKDVSLGCQESRCQSNDEDTCKQADGCYWLWTGCTACPTYDECSKYSDYQCTRCSWPKDNCDAGVLWGCNAK